MNEQRVRALIDAEGMHAPQEIRFMLRIMQRHAPRTGWGVNLGVFRGKSLMTMCEALGSERVVGIDDFSMKRKVSSRESAQRICSKRGYFPTILEQDSCLIPSQVDSVAVLFVDTVHTPERVREELTAWLPQLQPGALVMFHDYGPATKRWSKTNEDILRFQAYSKMIDNILTDATRLGRQVSTVAFKC